MDDKQKIKECIELLKHLRKEIDLSCCHTMLDGDENLSKIDEMIKKLTDEDNK